MRLVRKLRKSTKLFQAVDRRFHGKNWKLPKISRSLRNNVMKHVSNAQRNILSQRSVHSDCVTSVKVRKWYRFFCEKPQKPKGLFGSQTLTDLKTSKDLKKDWGCALKCSLWGQNGGHILKPHEILFKISFRPYQRWLNDTP